MFEIDADSMRCEEEFRSRTLAEFPSLAEKFAEYDGLLHVQMGALSHLVQDAIDGADYARVERSYHLLESLLTDFGILENAVSVSFLENLDFESEPNGEKARSVLPPRLHQLLLELEEHMQSLYDAQQREPS